MTSIAFVCRRVDRFCARLNDGLAAMAILLAVLTAIITIGRHPDIFLAPVDVETGAVDMF